MKLRGLARPELVWRLDALGVHLFVLRHAGDTRFLGKFRAGLEDSILDKDRLKVIFVCQRLGRLRGGLGCFLGGCGLGCAFLATHDGSGLGDDG